MEAEKRGIDVALFRDVVYDQNPLQNRLSRTELRCRMGKAAGKEAPFTAGTACSKRIGGSVTRGSASGISGHAIIITVPTSIPAPPA
jgi:hypothetical protein